MPGLGREREIKCISGAKISLKPHCDIKMRDTLSKDDFRNLIAKLILLPALLALRRVNPQRVSPDRRSGGTGRPEPDGLRAKKNRPVIPVAGLMSQQHV